MKTSNYVLLIAFILSANLVQSQEEKESKFNIITYAGIGYSIVQNDNQPNYNLNSNGGDFLLNYRINKKFGIATGIGLNELSGNGFNSVGNFYHERTLIKIPLIATMDYNVYDKFRVIANFGFYTQNIAKDEYQFLNSTQKNIFKGWNFGTQIGLGFVFEVFDNFNFGINYIGQIDLSKFKTTNNQIINDEQLTNLNTVGIIVVIDL
ncbi:PorT family protein [Polaribacter sp. MSW13]|uniref:PorT family protein n=1 Tax=Polaribacter marinus TaxID=2916838 RepID=A0A9X1VSY9_9FLAO|nr:outer membrane beta-barrel protein [Polaribacter marinus]MCI2230467.1 PorT family protein [Polaribacter marinus]